MARKLARVFDVTVDYLISEHDMPDILRDREMLDCWRNLDKLSEEGREHILSVLDGFIRDAKTREAYKVGS